MKKVLVALMVVSLFVVPALAANKTMTGADAIGTSSFNAAGKWNDGLAPSAGNSYSTLGWLIRTPSTSGSYTFGGDFLTLGGGSGSAVFTPGVIGNNCLIGKATNTTVTANFILDASTIRGGLGDADNWTVAGTLNVTGNGGNLMAQERFNVSAAISGSGTLYIGTNGNGSAARTVYINSGLNTYNGSISLMGPSANYARLTFADDSMMNFVIGANGVNNKISGTGTTAFNGDFFIDLTAAGVNAGDSWKLASATSQTFGSTFSVVGFTNLSPTAWRTTANGTNYLFSTDTGILKVVPEPATMLLLGLGSLVVARKKR